MTIPGSIIQDTVLIVSFVVGTIGNLAALWILYKSSNSRNKKHVLLLRWLATNDLISEVGMVLVLQLKRFQLIPCSWTCVCFVLLRAFGLGSGCVAFVMALERWLALTKPFLYHQVGNSLKYTKIHKLLNAINSNTKFPLCIVWRKFVVISLLLFLWIIVH